MPGALLVAALLTACGASGPRDEQRAGSRASTTTMTDPDGAGSPTIAHGLPPAPGPVPAAGAAPTTSTTPAAPAATAPDASTPTIGPEPVAIRSAAIGLHSVLEHVGLQADDGGVEVPDFAFAGWYRFGARPGQPGPTVIVGHVDSRGGPAVFFRLRDLVPGDTVEVELADGTVATYAVTGTQQFPKAEFPTFEVFGGTDDDVLRLITCTGEFDRGVRSYFDNLVVTAHRTT